MTAAIDDEAYSRRLSTAVAPRHGLRRWVDPQRPSRWNIRRLQLGIALDVGCGVGRHLAHLDAGSVGIDPNPHCIAVARGRGLTVWTTDEFESTAPVAEGSFDSLLLAHVLEHMPYDQAQALLARYLPFVRPGGKVVAICPQARGQRSDPTHVTFLPPTRLVELVEGAGLRITHRASFPLPFAMGRWFTHNETVVAGQLEA